MPVFGEPMRQRPVQGQAHTELRELQRGAHNGARRLHSVELRVSRMSDIRTLTENMLVREVTLVRDATTPAEDTALSGTYKRNVNSDSSVGGFVHSTSTVNKSAHVGKHIIIGPNSSVLAGVHLESDLPLFRVGIISGIDGY